MQHSELLRTGLKIARGARQLVCARARVAARRGVASELAGVAKRGSDGALNVEGVPSTAACSLLTLSPSRRAADASCSAV